ARHKNRHAKGEKGRRRYAIVQFALQLCHLCMTSDAGGHRQHSIVWVLTSHGRESSFLLQTTGKHAGRRTFLQHPFAPFDLPAGDASRGKTVLQSRPSLNIWFVFLTHLIKTGGHPTWHCGDPIQLSTLPRRWPCRRHRKSWRSSPCSTAAITAATTL